MDTLVIQGFVMLLLFFPTRSQIFIEARHIGALKLETNSGTLLPSYLDPDPVLHMRST